MCPPSADLNDFIDGIMTATRDAAESGAGIGGKRFVPILYGKHMLQDERLQPLVHREDFMLRALLPTKVKWNTKLRVALSTITVGRAAFLVSVFVMYLTICTICSVDIESIDSTSLCAGGPREPVPNGSLAGQLGAIMYTYADYRPAILNALATLLLAFYCNVALHHYQGAYFATQRLKQADCWQLPPSQPTATN